MLQLATAEEEDDATSKLVEQQQQQQPPPPPPPPANQSQGHALGCQDLKPEPREEAVDIAVAQPQPQLLGQGVLSNVAPAAAAVFHDQV